jgi:outer membrane biosynthesis protein TonB
MIPVVMSAVALAACGRHSAPANQAMSDDLKHDLDQVAGQGLDLASEQKSAAFPLTETAPKSAPAPSHSLKRAPGPKAVASKKPTVKAAPEPVVAENTEKPQAEAPAAPAPSPTVAQTPDPSAPAVPRPSPIPVDPNAGAGASGRDGGGRSTGTSDGGSILGGIFGVIIRGGIGDGDHCDPRTDGRRRGRGGVYIPPQRDPGIGLPPGIPTRLPRF